MASLSSFIEKLASLTDGIEMMLIRTLGNEAKNSKIIFSQSAKFDRHGLPLQTQNAHFLLDLLCCVDS